MTDFIKKIYNIQISIEEEIKAETDIVKKNLKFKYRIIVQRRILKYGLNNIPERIINHLTENIALKKFKRPV